MRPQLGAYSPVPHWFRAAAAKDGANAQGLPASSPQFLCPPAEQHLAKCSVDLASFLGMAPSLHHSGRIPYTSGLGTSMIRNTELGSPPPRG